jgi:hypothetical protein
MRPSAARPNIQGISTPFKKADPERGQLFLDVIPIFPDYKRDMTKNRLEAFSDGVIAIIITIMVLELHPPHEPSLLALAQLWPTFLSYALSFLIVAIYWVNHHHLFHLIEKVDTRILWTNMNLLFWLSLFPWVTGYMGQTGACPLAVSLYAFIAFACGVSSNLLRRCASHHAPHHECEIAPHRKRNRRSLIAITSYFLAIFTAWFCVPIAVAMVIFPMMMYFFADRIFPEQFKKD